MEAEYTISEKDYMNSVRLTARATRKQAILMGAVAFALLAAGTLAGGNLKVVVYSAVICGVIGYFLAIFLFSPLQAQRHYRDAGAFHTPISLALADGGIEFSTKNGRNMVEWKSLIKWRENDSLLLLYFAPKKFYIVPKRVAESGFDLEQLRRELRETLGEPLA